MPKTRLRTAHNLLRESLLCPATSRIIAVPSIASAFPKSPCYPRIMIPKPLKRFKYSLMASQTLVGCSRRILKSSRRPTILLRVETAGVAELAVYVVELTVKAFGVLSVEFQVGAIWRLLDRQFRRGAYGSDLPGRSKTGCSCCGAWIAWDGFHLGICSLLLGKRGYLQEGGSGGRGEWKGDDGVDNVCKMSSHKC